MERQGNMFRNLDKDEIEVRVGSFNKSRTGFSALLYKTARTDARIFDETFGPMGWQCDYRSIDGKLFCRIYVYDKDTREWIAKENVGTESNTEKEKGEASDALKRAGFTWGCGVELYTAPFIWFSHPSGGTFPEKPTVDFEITGYECSKEKQITYLEICAKAKDSNKTMQKMKCVFGSPSKGSAKPNPYAEDQRDTPASVVTDEDTHARCADCGKPILDHGKITSASLVEGTKCAYGRQLCWECAAKAKNSAKSE